VSLCCVKQPHHTTYVSSYAFNGSRSDEYMAAAHTGRERRADTLAAILSSGKKTVHKRSAAARIGLVRIWLQTCARRSPYSFLKKPSSGRGWLMPGREASGDRIHLQFPIEFHRRSKRLSRKCWSMRRHVLCILNFMLLYWWSLIKSNADQEIYISFYFVNIIVNNKCN